MSDTVQGRYDRTEEDVGNVVELGHVNITVPDQILATAFYISGLGLTRDPYLVTGIENMWVNVGSAQFHLPLRPAQVVRGIVGLVLPDLESLLRRLSSVRQHLVGTRFDYRDHGAAVEVTCPWGNRIRCHAPQSRFGRITLGMPYVEFSVPEGTAEGIARFYREMLDAPAGTARDDEGPHAYAVVGTGNKLIFRETATPLPPYDGHHVQISLQDFSGPHRRLSERGLITEESDQHQYRFCDIVDPASSTVLFSVEHEVRSMKHPMFARPLVNRNAAVTPRTYRPGHESWAWAAPD